MADEPRPPGWWQTVPGILTATAAVITAVAGLIAALSQAGVFTASRPAQSPASRPATAPPAPPPSGAAVEPGSRPPSPASPANPTARVLPAATEVKVGSAVYRILAAELDRRNAETLTLRLTMRMSNTDRFPANLWDESFRLRVEGVPRAPVGNLNKLVQARTAEEGVVEFVIPASTRKAVLEVRQADESTEIALDLAEAPRG